MLARRALRPAAQQLWGLLQALMTCFPASQSVLSMLRVPGGGTADVAFRAQQLLEHSLLGELRAVVARALSGLEMFSGQLSELISGEVVAPPPTHVCKAPCLSRT